MIRLIAATAFAFLVSVSAGSPATAQSAARCAKSAETELQSLPLGPNAVTAIQYERKLNPRDQGPPVVGYRAWVRLDSCSGYLVIDMTRSCFVRQSYTRGNCAVEGVTRY